MSFKTKALGLAAATALSLSIVSGALADNSGTQATLQDGDACASSASSGLINFGTWKYDGDGNYTFQTASNGSTLKVNVTNTQIAEPTCVVTMSAGALTGDVNGKVIDSSNSTITFDGNGDTTNKYNVTAPYGDVSIGATLDITDFSNLVPDVYKGAVTIGVANAAP